MKGNTLPPTALTSIVLKFLAFSISKTDIIQFNTLFYNTYYIKSSIFTYNTLK